MAYMSRNELRPREKRYEDGFRIMQGEREYVTYPENASVRVWFSDIPWRYENHVHSAVEIVMTLEGTVDYVVEQRNYTVRKNEILIVPPEKVHSLNMGENSSRLLYLFEPDSLMSLRDFQGIPGLMDRIFHVRDGSETHTRISEMLLKIQQLEKDKEICWNAEAYSYIVRIYAMLIQHYIPGAVNRRKEAPQGVDQEVISSAMGYINEHFQEDLSLDDVAAFAGFNRYYFSRSFKRQTGYFFKDYLCQKRLQTAMDLLIRTDLPMKDVAIKSGFGSVATFNRIFREKMDCTPTRYRAIYGER